MSSNTYHTPVLLQACIDNLNIQPAGVYVDLTFGGGGHSREILKNLGPAGKLFAFDQDEDAARNVPEDKRFTLIPQNFRYLKNYLRVYGINQVDGILGDLGVSSHQFDEAERGFSIRFDAPLDMRMNRNNPFTAKDVVNTYSREKLIALLKEFGELSNAGRIARLLESARSEKAIETTSQLRKALEPCTPKAETNKFLARVFQALRIEVNGEMQSLKECLLQCTQVLKPGARLVIISYHSLEDRLVKNVIKTGNTQGTEEKDMIYGRSKKWYRNLSSKPIVPGAEEIISNPRARSARLRVAERVEE